MLFNSPEFLFLFLPVVLIGFYWLQNKGNPRLIMCWLVVCSLFFYGWWNPVYLLLILGSASVNYRLGRMLTPNEGRNTKLWLTIGIAFNIGLLAYFKYANFFLDNMAVALDADWNFSRIILPLAISFYTFQQITYLVDTSKQKTDAHGFLEYLLFVCFFPQLIAGPIVHHSEMLTQFRTLATPGDRTRQMAIGLSILAIGLFKKVVIADGLALYSTPLFSLANDGADFTALEALVGSFSYAFQLYFDFSGYSDMAIGLACLFGLKLPVNFYSPYRAQNISDFWRMWHATLSRFLRDYVYTPLGGFVCSPVRQRFNLFSTMFVGGVWHGAGWTFVVYGFCHGIFVVVHQLWRVNVSGPLNLVRNPVYQAAAQVFTFLTVVMALVVFRAESLTAAIHVFSQMIIPSGDNFIPAYLISINRTGLFQIVGLFPVQVAPPVVIFSLLSACLAVCWLLPNTYQLFAAEKVTIDKGRAGRAPIINLQWNGSTRWAMGTAVLIALSFLNLGQVSEFLYFQF